MKEQLHRYFVGAVGFAFVACWSALGTPTAIAALLVCVVLVAGPGFVSTWTSHRRTSARRPRHTQASMRPLRHGPANEELPLVPDEPSLILELGALR